MFYRVAFVCGFCALLLTVAACHGPETATPETPGQQDRVPTVPVPPQEGQKQQVQPQDANTAASEMIAQFGDKKLTMQHIRWRVPNPTDQQIAALGESWIEMELLYQEAQKRGLLDDPKVSFLAEMQKKGSIAKQLKTQVAESVQITDQMVLTYYEQNKDKDVRLASAGFVGFSHVKTKTLEQAESVLKRIKAGEDINELAKALSVADDADKGGKVGRSTYRRIKELYGSDFFEKLKAAKQNELIGPVETDAAYEVARKELDIKPELKPFEEVEAYLRGRLQRSEGAKAVESLLEEIKENNADRIVKSDRLVEAEKAAAQKPPATRGRVGRTPAP